VLNMSIEKLKNSLLSEANEEAEKIVASAQAHVDNMLNEERSKSAALRTEAEMEVSKLLAEQYNERTAWARLEAKRILAEAREDAIENVLEDFFESLSKIRKSPEYKSFLKVSVEKASSELGGSVTIHILKGDKECLPKLKGASIVEDLEGLGGAMVESSDGKVRVNLTLETLFETRRDELRKQIFQKLFESK